MNDKQALLSGYQGVDVCAVSDALEALDLPSGFGGINPLWCSERIVGTAATAELAPHDGSPSGSHILTSAVEASGSGDVIVVANQGRTDVSCWGGILSLAASLNHVRGVVADGVCRDVDEAAAMDLPLYARGSTPRTARGKLRQVSAGAPVVINGVTVNHGDIVVADRSGVAFVPIARAGEVLERARAIVGREAGIADDVRRGVPITEAMNDARLAGESAEVVR